jgi:hypothetical membrane protein
MVRLNRIFYWTNHVLVFFRSFMVMVMVTVDRWRRSKLPKFMAAVTITINTINVMVMVAPVGDAFSTVTIKY